MGYRTNKPPKPEDHLRKFAVRNGATMRLMFGCYYMYNHDTKYHDHVGWPRPDSPDDICQFTSNMRVYPIKNKTADFEPIHLNEEGYNKTIVAYEDSEQAANLDTESWIDKDNFIRMNVKANFETFHDKPIDIKFTLFVLKADGSDVDAVCHGVITVLPGAPCPSS